MTPPRERLSPAQAVALVASLAVLVTLLLHLFGLGVVEFDDLREGQLETAAAMVLLFIGAVLLGRFRLYGSRRDLLLVAAVFVLALDNLVSTFLTTASDSLTESGFATWAAAADGVLGALVLAAAAVLPDRPVRRRGRALVAAAATCTAMVVVILGLAAAFGDSLPGAFDTTPQTAADLRLLSAHPIVLAVEASTALCYAVAAVAFARLAEDTDDDFMKWLGMGSVIAAVAFVNYALFPSEFTELLYVGDFFFLPAVAVLLVGAIREISNVEAALVRSAVLDERRRVARDLNEGVVTELTYVTSQTDLLTALPRDRQPFGNILDAVERALEESRGAVASLNRPYDEPFDVALGHAARDAAERVGVRLHLDIDKNVGITPDWRDALLRVTREAIAGPRRATAMPEP